MNQGELDKATKIAKTVEGRMFRGVSQLDVDLVHAGYTQALKDERERIVSELSSLIDLRNKPETLTIKFLDWLEGELEALKRGEKPEEGK